MSKPKVTLFTGTAYPAETLWCMWQASRTEAPVPTPAEVYAARKIDVNLAKSVDELFGQLLEMDIPVTDGIYFSFLLENVSIAFREQMVRHRLGVRVADRMSFDVIPDEMGSSWWMQTSRITDHSSFYDQGKYRSSPNAPVGSEAHYHMDSAYYTAQSYYQALLREGVPMEEARMVLPLGLEHRLTWTLSLTALKRVIGKRACWIPQIDLWEPIIGGMVTELVDKVSDLFAELASPPCMKGDSYTGCKFSKECLRRISGDDPLPPCPLYVHKEFTQPFKPEHPDYDERYLRYVKLWRRNPSTGKRLTAEDTEREEK